MKKLIILALMGASAASALAAATHGTVGFGGRVDFRRNGFYEGSWGEWQVGGNAAHMASIGGGSGLLLGVGAYQSGVTSNLGNPLPSFAAGPTFQTFCVERDENLLPRPIDIYVSVQDDTTTSFGSHAWNGGLGDDDATPGDDLDQRTAYLYQGFAAGTLSGYDFTNTGVGGLSNNLTRAQTAATLQMAIWYLENEIDLPLAKSYLNTDQDALLDYWLADSTANASGIGKVRILQTAHTDGSNGQDLLYIVPVPGAVLLGVLGLGAAGWLKRR